MTAWILYLMFWRANVPVLIPGQYLSKDACLQAGQNIQRPIVRNFFGEERSGSMTMPYEIYCVEVPNAPR